MAKIGGGELGALVWHLPVQPAAGRVQGELCVHSQSRDAYRYTFG